MTIMEPIIKIFPTFPVTLHFSTGLRVHRSLLDPYSRYAPNGIRTANFTRHDLGKYFPLARTCRVLPTIGCTLSH